MKMNNFKLNVKKMNIKQYRGKNYVLKVDTQEQWDSIIPQLRKNKKIKFTFKDFNEYKNIVIYLNLINNEYMGDIKNVHKKFIIINFPNPIVELW